MSAANVVCISNRGRVRRRANSAVTSAVSLGGVSTGSRTTAASAPGAANNSIFTAISSASIVLRFVAQTIGLAVMLMTKAQLQRECEYGGAMAIADRLLAAGIITQEDYIKIKKLYLKKYAPVVAGSGENPKIVP